LNQVYAVDDLGNISGLEFTHDPFRVVTRPIVHELCGQLVYTSTFMEESIDDPAINVFADAFSHPVGYNQGNRTHTVYT